MGSWPRRACGVNFSSQVLAQDHGCPQRHKPQEGGRHHRDAGGTGALLASPVPQGRKLLLQVHIHLLKHLLGFDELFFSLRADRSFPLWASIRNQAIPKHLIP